MPAVSTSENYHLCCWTCCLSARPSFLTFHTVNVLMLALYNVRFSWCEASVYIRNAVCESRTLHYLYILTSPIHTRARGSRYYSERVEAARQRVVAEAKQHNPDPAVEAKAREEADGAWRRHLAVAAVVVPYFAVLAHVGGLVA